MLMGLETLAMAQAKREIWSKDGNEINNLGLYFNLASSLDRAPNQKLLVIYQTVRSKIFTSWMIRLLRCWFGRAGSSEGGTPV